jgi:N-sulfoglucosamine sulfohydrolase
MYPHELVFDPTEACDRSADPASAGTLESVRASLSDWMRETNDPLLNGFVPAPPGLLVNPVDGDSPQREPRAT